ncbi:MAG: hypothetical protein A2937_00275 [Candidatus Yonathbacteria bacterium RIFCSPLOWO2_01_FULL_47_33b]|uniref:Uncharacterized protein n=1 Tax=Candidatus Yonathbacteria bacterium RIFCSPLOWO2_01_FULL_47_33b TaxID=1802727 RepID=A0A1G2SGJ1_9BACT|nr:MAG: hypothetical protein A2937_00275 [Candidatus Yonathbacteria bacterium RIFCSPLOWO2_01_FULL_47_33b]
MNEEISMRTESGYLISSNKERCSILIRDSDLSANDMIDIFISLHLVLEVSLNAFFRNLSLLSIKKDVDTFEIIKNVDSVNFIDKTIMFIYNSKFNFTSEEELREATRYHSIIGNLKDFSAMRNQLLHGHAISTVFDGRTNRHSRLKQNINLENLKRHILNFQFIFEGMRFYLDKLDSPLTASGKENFKETYLNDTFLPRLR